MWPLSAWLWLRTTVNLSAMAAHFWQCSVKNVPGTFVGIVLNGPRISGGASGLGSHISCCGGPPSRKMKMQALALARGAAAEASAASRFGSVSPASIPPPSLSMWRREKPSQDLKDGPENGKVSMAFSSGKFEISNLKQMGNGNQENGNV